MTTPGPTGQVRYTPALEDVVAAIRLGAVPGPWRRLAGAVLFGILFAGLDASGVTGGGLAGLMHGGLQASAILALCMAVVWFALFPWAVRLTAARRAQAYFAQQASLQGLWDVAWGPDGLRTVNARIDALQPWTDFRFRREDAHVVLLYQTNLTFQLLPCRVLTRDHWRTLRPLLDQVPPAPSLPRAFHRSAPPTA